MRRHLLNVSLSLILGSICHCTSAAETLRAQLRSEDSTIGLALVPYVQTLKSRVSVSQYDYRYQVQNTSYFRGLGFAILPKFKIAERVALEAGFVYARLAYPIDEKNYDTLGSLQFSPLLKFYPIQQLSLGAGPMASRSFGEDHTNYWFQLSVGFVARSSSSLQFFSDLRFQSEMDTVQKGGPQRGAYQRESVQALLGTSFGNLF